MHCQGVDKWSLISGKVLQKTIIFVVSCFDKFETVRLSKFQANPKRIGIFVIAGP